MASSQQQSGSATSPSEKTKTEHLVFAQIEVEKAPGAKATVWEPTVSRIRAWSPPAALEVAKERAPAIEKAAAVAVVAVGSFHVFKPKKKTETVFERQIAEPTGA